MRFFHFFPQDVGGTEESIAEEHLLEDEEAAPEEASSEQDGAQVVLDDPEMEGTILGS